MKINLSYQFVLGGKYNGLPALVLRPGKKELGSNDLSEIILQSIADFGMNLPILILDSREEEFKMEDIGNLLSVIESVRSEKKALIMAYVNGNYKPPYLGLNIYTIVFITEKTWLMYKATEIRFVPEYRVENEKKIEPEVGEVNLKPIPSPKYIVARKGDMIECVKFVQESSSLWGIIMEPSSKFEIQIYGE